MPADFTAANVSELIAAINAANLNSEADNIALVAGTTFTLTEANNTTNGATGLPTITAGEGLTIVGNGSIIERNTVAGTPAFRLLDVAVGASLTLENMTLQGGLAFGAAFSARGGCILNLGALNLNGVAVQNNIALGRNSAGLLLSAPGAGGGIYTSGSLSLEDTTMLSNQATGGSGGLAGTPGAGPFATPGANGHGGGLYVSSGTAALRRVAMVSNLTRGGIGGNGPTSGTRRDGAVGGGAVGGGLYVLSGTVSLDEVTLSLGSAQGGRGGNGSGPGNGGDGGDGRGGGLYAADGTLTLRQSNVNDNSVTGGLGGSGSPPGTQGHKIGGGIYIAESLDELVMERSSIANNHAGSAAGLFIQLNGPLQVSDCTVSGNQANSQPGGGMYLAGPVASGSFIRNCTISGNTSGPGSFGGGLALSINGTLPILNSTITGNSAGAAAGGGIAVSPWQSLLGNVSLNSTIVAGNIAGSGPDLRFTSPSSVSGNNNLIGVANSGDFTLTGIGNLTGTLAVPLNPMLAPLFNNGGPTQTHAVLAGSPAINSGNNSAGLTTDQRGLGFPRVVAGAADIGAFEVQGAPTIASTRINDGSAQRSRVTSLTVTFNSQVEFAGTVAGAFTLSRNGGKPVSIKATSSIVNGVTVVTLWDFTGGSTQFGSLADGRYTLTALAGQISAGGVLLDGDGDGQPGGNYTFGDTQGLFRMYGDINGDRQVDGLDFSAFSSTYGLISGQAAFLWYFDINGDGVIDGVEFSQFSGRFNTLLP